MSSHKLSLLHLIMHARVNTKAATVCISRSYQRAATSHEKHKYLSENLDLSDLTRMRPGGKFFVHALSSIIHCRSVHYHNLKSLFENWKICAWLATIICN